MIRSWRLGLEHCRGAGSAWARVTSCGEAPRRQRDDGAHAECCSATAELPPTVNGRMYSRLRAHGAER
eukprot:CAMPEP_0170286276 /NCGR_PEP_ID=MMETSP0116_2-20130129/43192_1 /TAXON_ID=400756 /ORGANISM="Durinskia baltica, Strain CSIRO CS-38" /LENGTH=67 /DNA_ID=CAMNT_0010537687 /DNA_START=66 /DNA_END=265 /DNA_ORIENTATION=+